MKLSDDERDLIIRNRAQGVPAAERTGFYGLVKFAPGPRGGRFRPVRTAIVKDAETALDLGIALSERRWIQRVIEVKVVEVDSYGKTTVIA